MNVSWAAGLFEGEGCIYRLRGDSWALQVGSTDLDVLEHFRDIVECGTIREHKDKTRPTSRRRAWLWQVGSAAEVARLLHLFEPFMGERRRAKTAEALEDLARPRDSRGWDTRRARYGPSGVACG